jgi:hypothetical protein
MLAICRLKDSRYKEQRECDTRGAPDEGEARVVEEGAPYSDDWAFVAWGSKNSAVETRCVGVSKVKFKRCCAGHGGTPFHCGG